MMLFQELLEDEYFIKLLDSNNSKELAIYLSNLRSQQEILTTDYRHLTQMFKDLDIFQDIYLYKTSNLDKNIKYVVTGGLIRPIDKTLDLRDKYLATHAIEGPKNCKIFIDSTTKWLEEPVVTQEYTISIQTDDPNEIYINSLPEKQIISFVSYNDSDIHTKIKLNKNIINFKDFLYEQPLLFSTNSENFIENLLKNVEVI